MKTINKHFRWKHKTWSDHMDMRNRIELQKQWELNKLLKSYWKKSFFVKPKLDQKVLEIFFWNLGLFGIRFFFFSVKWKKCIFHVKRISVKIYKEMYLKS